MGKLFTEGEFTLEFGDDAVDQDFVEMAFRAVRTRGKPLDLKLAGPCDVWGFTHDGRRVQVFKKDLATEVAERQG